MRGRLRAAVGWLLIALALWGLFRVADALPGDRYELRFDAPLTAGQAEAFCRAAGTSALDLALWREDPVTVTTPLGRSAETRQAAVYGSPALCFPVGYLYGTAPGAGQQDGCALRAGLAEDRVGGRGAVGAHNVGFTGDAQLFQLLPGGFHYRQIAVASHDDGNFFHSSSSFLKSSFFKNEKIYFHSLLAAAAKEKGRDAPAPSLYL